MSTKQVGTVLVAVPLYEVEGHPACIDGKGIPCFFLRSRDEEDERPEFCGYPEHEGDVPFVQDETGYWYNQPTSHCPLRQPDALTLDDLRMLAAGRKRHKAVGLVHPLGDMAMVCCHCDGPEYVGGELLHAPDCPTVLAQAHYDAVMSKVNALTRDAS